MDLGLLPGSHIGAWSFSPSRSAGKHRGGGELTSGKPVTVTISKVGQEIKYTFAATANKNVTLHVTKFEFTSDGSTGSVYLYLYEPGSSTDYTDCYFDANGTCTVKTPVGGTWSIALLPNGASVGSLTIELT